MMNPTAFHKQYEDMLSAFQRQLPDAGLRVLLSREADPFFRQCALAIWTANGSGLLPEAPDYYNAVYSRGRQPERALFWELSDMAQSTSFTLPPFFLRMCRYDQETGHTTSRRFLRTFSLLCVHFAAVDSAVTPEEAALIQQWLDTLSAHCDQAQIPADAPVTVAQFITGPHPTASPGHPPADSPAQPVPPPPKQTPSATPQTAPSKEEPPPPTLEELLAQLDELCGLKKVKEDVRSLINLVKVRKLREENQLPVPPMSLHMVFLGNPGTGKTTVARLLSQIYRAIGVLSKGQLVEVDRSGLVAGYVGQTAIKTGEAIQRALGGVLFIDEAYSLANAENDNDFGREAIEILLKGMEDNRKDLVVITAGYTDLMEKFIHSNPGLESRFNKYLHFDDYSGEELMDIFRSLCKKNGYTLAPETETLAAQYFIHLFITRDENFGNAREVRNIFERAVSKQADRVSALATPSKEDLMLLLPEDLKK